MTAQTTWRGDRRAFIRTHHPDRGGDSAMFVAGLAALDASLAAAECRPVRVVFRRHRPLHARLLTTVRDWRHPPPPRVR